MAITSNHGIWNAETHSYDPGPETVEHAGRVLSVYRRDHQAMSDVYTVATYAKVFQDDGSALEVLVNANFECDVSFGRAEVDASPEMRLAHECWKEARAEEEKEKERQYLARRAEEQRCAPARGKKMVVAKGKDKGKTGTVAFVKGAKALLKDDACWEDRKADGTWYLCSSLSLRA